MGPEYFFMNGMWVFPLIGISVMLFMMFFVFGRGNFKNMSSDEKSDSPLDIVKKRFAKGEITKEEFEEIKKDI